MNDPQGDTGGAPGNETPPPSGPKGIGQCPLASKKPKMEDEEKPVHLTTKEWAAFNIAEESSTQQYSVGIYANGN